MAKRDKRIDAYIDKAPPFARPILKHFRALVHRGCPDVIETLKWSMPAFEHQGLMCGMAAFKQHATITFWKGELVLGKGGKDGAMGHFGRLTSIEELPRDSVLLGYIRKAAELNETGVKASYRTGPKAPRKKPIPVPSFFAAALEQNPVVRANFESLSPSHQREYLEWLTEAKREETRDRRLATALAQIGEAKSLNWKYCR